MVEVIVGGGCDRESMQGMLLSAFMSSQTIQWLPTIRGVGSACIVDQALLLECVTHLQKLQSCIVLMVACPSRTPPHTTICMPSRRRAGHCCRKRVQLKFVITVVYQQALGAAVLLHGGTARVADGCCCCCCAGPLCAACAAAAGAAVVAAIAAVMWTAGAC